MIDDDRLSTGMAALAGGIGGLALGGTVGYLAGKRKSKKVNRRRRKSSRRIIRKRNNSYRKRGSRQRKPYTAGKRRDTSHRRIRFTKNNQPYVILPNGRARFIKKSSARNSRKRSGGRY